MSAFDRDMSVKGGRRDKEGRKTNQHIHPLTLSRSVPPPNATSRFGWAGRGVRSRVLSLRLGRLTVGIGWRRILLPGGGLPPELLRLKRTMVLIGRTFSSESMWEEGISSRRSAGGWKGVEVYRGAVCDEVCGMRYVVCDELMRCDALVTEP